MERRKTEAAIDLSLVANMFWSCLTGPTKNIVEPRDSMLPRVYTTANFDGRSINVGAKRVSKAPNNTHTANPISLWVRVRLVASANLFKRLCSSSGPFSSAPIPNRSLIRAKNSAIAF